MGHSLQTRLSFLIKYISDKRMETYKKGTSDNSLTEALELYIWNAKLSENFYFLLQTLEVSFRNAIYASFCDKFPNDNLFFIDETNPREHYRKNKEYHSVECWKMLCKVKYELSKGDMIVSDGKIIAELNFGFWTHLMSNHYEMRLWRPIIKSVVPNMPKSKSMREALLCKLNRIRAFRNRVFHYEPIFNKNLAEPMHSDIMETLGWMSGELREFAESFDEFDALMKSGKQKIAKTLDEFYKN